jgi:hypothetical protein
VAPLPKIWRNPQALLGLKCAVWRDAGNGQDLSIIQSKFVVGADEYLVARSNFDLPRASDVERIGAAQIEDDSFLETRSTTTSFRSTRATVADEAGAHDLSRFVVLPLSLLLIGPAKRLVDFEAHSFSGEHADFFQTLADRVGKTTILIPGKRHGQAPI